MYFPFNLKQLKFYIPSRTFEIIASKNNVSVSFTTELD